MTFRVACLSHSDSLVRRNTFLLNQGVNPQGTGTQGTGLFNQPLMIPFTYFTQLQYSYLYDYAVVPSAAHEQGLRKSFDLRRTYGLNTNC